MNYTDFINRKSQCGENTGFEPVWMPNFLFDFQKHLVEWSVRKGRAAIFADCGLGKTPMQLVWAENVARHTGKRVLVIAPLAVALQTQREAEKFGIDAKVSRDGALHRITITNYERLHYFKQEDFIGAVADESSAIKAFDGRRRKQVVRFFSKLPYRLLCTATPSPNDFIELGTQSECLGIMNQSDMLGFFFRETENMRHSIFKNDDFWNKIKWWFKPHSEQPFWRWVASWARALRTPSDIGFDGSKFVLPELKPPTRPSMSSGKANGSGCRCHRLPTRTTTTRVTSTATCPSQSGLRTKKELNQTDNTMNNLTSVTRYLSEFETADDLLAACRFRRLRGVPVCTSHCIVAELIRNEFPDVGCIEVIPDCDGYGELWIDGRKGVLPKVASNFALEFDDGLHWDLLTAKAQAIEVDPEDDDTDEYEHGGDAGDALLTGSVV